MMIDTDKFVKKLKKEGYTHLCVVPCSFAKNLINSCINNESIEYIACASEAVACSIAAGLKVAGKKPIVIMQSSGLTNAGSCVTSLLKPYNITFPIITSWRTYKEGDSEIQHKHLATELPKLVEAGEDFYGFSVPFQWFDIGTTRDYFQTIMKVLKGEVNGVKPHGREVMPGVWAGINLSVDFSSIEIVPPVYIGGSVKIEPGVKIVGPAVIGSGCVIESGAYIERSIIMEYTKVSGIANLKEKIVAGKYCINPLGVSIDIEEADFGWIVDDARKEERKLSEEERAIIEAIMGLND